MAENFPPPRKITSLQNLMRLKSKDGHQWGVFAYALNRDMIKKDGTLDDLHAVGFLLGSYSNEEDASQFAKDIISLTGHPAIIAAKYAQPIFLTSNHDPSKVVEVPLDNKGKILELESNEYKHEKEMYEKRIKQEKELLKEANEETNPDSIEHFKRQCYLAIKNKASYVVHTKEAEKSLESYNKHQKLVKEHFIKHPEHEKEWLPYLKEKLTERGELDLYLNIEGGYKEIRNELLGLENTDLTIDDSQIKESSNLPCDDGVCLVQQNKPLSKRQKKNKKKKQKTPN